jgi:hypothetical protein
MSEELKKEEPSEEEKRLDAMAQAEAQDPYREIGFEELADILGSTIKFDRGNKVITFLTMLGTYTDEEQSNIMFRAESSTGKSYIPLEIAEYFPEEDIEKVSYASPTSFFHKYGQKTQTDKTIKVVNGEPVKETHIYYLIDMSKKIYIFKDMPSVALLERLRSLLSHDEKEMQIQFTNKMEKSGYRTQHIVIKGYPTIIFCTAMQNVFDMQESTRFLVLSPDVDIEKIGEAIKLLAQRRGNKKLYIATLDADTKRHWLKQRIRNVKGESIFDVVIPEEAKVAEDFIKSKEFLHPRHMRDFGRLLSLIKYWAILNCWKRKSEMTDKGKIVYANETDVEVGFILYNSICEANELGLSPEVHNIYTNVFEKIDSGSGLTKEQISIAFLKIYHRPLGSRRLDKEILPNLLAVGLIYDVEGTGTGGKPKVYRLSKYIDHKENGEKIKDDKGQTLLISQLPPIKTIQEKLEFMLKMFVPQMGITIKQIEEQTNGKIPHEEIPKLLKCLIDDGKIYQPDGYTYSIVG